MSEEPTLSAILQDILQAHVSSLANDSSYESAKAKLAEERRRLGGLGRNWRMTKVLSYEKLVLVLALVLLPLGRHFHGRREFSVSWLEKSIDTVMGLYIRFIVSQAETMKKLASNDDFPDYQTVNATLEQADNDGPEGAEAQKQIGLWKTQIANSQGISDLTVFDDVFDDIDTYTEEVFSACAHTDIGEKTDAYLSALTRYRPKIITTLRKRWLEASNEAIEATDIMRQYDKITARIAVWLSPQGDANNAPIPLLSAWLLDYAWSSLNAVKEGVIEVCRWFEPLLEYYPLLHTKSHEMDDKTEVMVNHVAGIYAPDADLQLCHFLWERRNTLIFHLHNTMSTISEKETQQDRPKDMVQINDTFDKLPGDEKRAFKQLLTSMKNASKKGLHSMYGIGAHAMRVTAWNWRNKALKNAKRDIEPLVKAVLLELQKARKYRAAILTDPIVAGLRKQLEDILVRMMKLNFGSRLGNKLVTSTTWQWWDEIKIPKDVTPIMSTNIDENFRLKLRQTQLEQQDQDAITGLVAYVEHMTCAKSTTEKDSVLNSEVIKTLNALVYVSAKRSTKGTDSLHVTYTRIRLSSPTVLVSITVAWRGIQICLATSGQPFISRFSKRATKTQQPLQNESDPLLVCASGFTGCPISLLISSLRIARHNEEKGLHLSLSKSCHF
ncbi:uncharacterized protein EDB93DRAFT_1119853 [Suillus bovinus]|uniref:uncharacterized protein n=1 Tax=Suillus bovinus TaxID=48563 RepID=UPI001B88273E|nr:uncharacterized protein EDB93DRAFT_1119853 [Suillus bovinus]KAG2158691.1 hypothetical protein EDB93DRAFT_1119853 [Suillus bovinus]